MWGDAINLVVGCDDKSILIDRRLFQQYVSGAYTITIVKYLARHIVQMIDNKLLGPTLLGKVADRGS